MNASEERQYIESRMATYQFLSSVYLYEVDIDFLTELKSNPEAFEGALKSYAESLEGADLEQVRIDAASDFSKYLLNMSRSPVHPYESVYTSEKKLLMQEARDKAVAAYRQAGFEKSESLNIPEDHIGVEFEFMGLLCQKELEAYDERDALALQTVRDEQEAFVKNHLLNWVPQLCADLKKRAKGGLYEGIAETTELFLEFEEEAFGLS